MCSVPRVEDDDDSRYVFESIGPAPPMADAERLGIQRFMQRVVRDVLANEADYGPLRDPLILLAENYARTCQTREELDRRLTSDARDADERGAAATLMRRIWKADIASESI